MPAPNPPKSDVLVGAHYCPLWKQGSRGAGWELIEPYPERMYLEANVGPVIKRGIKHANWELEYLVKERDARLCKLYTPEDDGAINDRRLWPFYEKASELGVPLTLTRYEDVLAMPDVDVVNICTPPMLHRPQAIAALKDLGLRPVLLTGDNTTTARAVAYLVPALALARPRSIFSSSPSSPPSWPCFFCAKPSPPYSSWLSSS